MKYCNYHQQYYHPITTFGFEIDNILHFESIVMLVAVVLGCQPSSTHLWSHLFSQETILGFPLFGCIVCLFNCLCFH